MGTENHDGIVSEIGDQGKFFQDFCYQDDHQGPANPAGIFDPEGQQVVSGFESRHAVGVGGQQQDKEDGLGYLPPGSPGIVLEKTGLFPE